MLLTKMHFTLQWILFSMVIPISMQNIHHLPGIRVNSTMQNTVSYEVVPGVCLFLHIYSIHSAVQMLQALYWVLKHKQARHGLPKLPEGHASSVHCAETKSQHSSNTDPRMAPCVVCKTCRCWTYTVLSTQFFKQCLVFLCRSRPKHDRHFIRK